MQKPPTQVSVIRKLITRNVRKGRIYGFEKAAQYVFDHPECFARAIGRPGLEMFNSNGKVLTSGILMANPGGATAQQLYVSKAHVEHAWEILEPPEEKT